MTRLTPAEFARRKNVNRSTVTRWVQGGRIQLDGEGLIDVAAAERALQVSGSVQPHHVARVEQAADERAQRRGSGGDEGDVAGDATPATAGTAPSAFDDASLKIGLRMKMARMRSEEIAAETAAMNRDKAAKLLVTRADAMFVLEDVVRTLGGLLDRLADRYTPDIVALQGDTALVHKALTEAARDIRKELAQQLRRRSEEIL